MMDNHKHYVNKYIYFYIDISGVPGVGKTATVLEV